MALDADDTNEVQSAVSADEQAAARALQLLDEAFDANLASVNEYVSKAQQLGMELRKLVGYSGTHCPESRRLLEQLIDAQGWAHHYLEIKNNQITELNRLRWVHRTTFGGAVAARLAAIGTKIGSRWSARLIAYGIPFVGFALGVAETALGCTVMGDAEPYRPHVTVETCLENRDRLIAVSDEILERFGTTETTCQEGLQGELARLASERNKLTIFMEACYSSWTIVNPDSMEQYVADGWSANYEVCDAVPGDDGDAGGGDAGDGGDASDGGDAGDAGDAGDGGGD